MVDPISGKESLRVTGDEDIGFVSADLAHNITAEVHVRDEVAVGIGHDVDGFGTDDLCRGVLFFVADGAELVGRHFGMCGGIETFVATGEEHVGDVMSLTCPFGKSPAAEEFWVIGVGEDDEDVLRGVPGIRGYQVSGSRYQV